MPSLVVSTEVAPEESRDQGTDSTGLTALTGPAVGPHVPAPDAERALTPEQERILTNLATAPAIKAEVSNLATHVEAHNLSQVNIGGITLSRDELEVEGSEYHEKINTLRLELDEVQKGEPAKIARAGLIPRSITPPREMEAQIKELDAEIFDNLIDAREKGLRGLKDLGNRDRLREEFSDALEKQFAESLVRVQDRKGNLLLNGVSASDLNVEIRVNGEKGIERAELTICYAGYMIIYPFARGAQGKLEFLEKELAFAEIGEKRLKQLNLDEATNRLRSPLVLGDITHVMNDGQAVSAFFDNPSPLKERLLERMKRILQADAEIDLQDVSFVVFERDTRGKISLAELHAEISVDDTKYTMAFVFEPRDSASDTLQLSGFTQPF